MSLQMSVKPDTQVYSLPRSVQCSIQKEIVCLAPSLHCVDFCTNGTKLAKKIQVAVSIALQLWGIQSFRYCWANHWLHGTSLSCSRILHKTMQRSALLWAVKSLILELCDILDRLLFIGPVDDAPDCRTASLAKDATTSCFCKLNTFGGIIWTPYLYMWRPDTLLFQRNTLFFCG
jgi:hypothetical protein